jgi:hypothetical protein
MQDLKQIYGFEEFTNIHAAFFHQLVLLFESLWVNWLKHGLIVRVVPFKVFEHLFKRKELCLRFAETSINATASAV